MSSNPSQIFDMERDIIRAAIVGLISSGFVVSVDDGGDTPISKSKDVSAILAAMYGTSPDHWAVDEHWLYVRSEFDGHKKGFVHLVHGNDGFDVISDHSGFLESALESAFDVAQHCEENPQGWSHAN